MCDQTEISYLEDDVVWVKIGPIWWPGVVKDLEKNEEGKEILAGLKKKPIAAVKFFQEDNYEFVKNLDCIYHYGCRRKDEFIKKGLDKFRTGAPHMKKFPLDVTTAESLTNGDVNIINNPKFLPEKKESYSEIFGSTKKKSKKESDLSPRSRGRPAASVTPYRPITHQRFINKALHGESDHRVKTLIQTSATSDDSTSKNPYKCHICKFETSRVNVIVAHHRLSHSSKNSINWTGSDSKLIRKRPSFKSRKVKAKKLFETSYDDLSDDEILEKKKSPKSKSSKEKLKSPDKSKSSEKATSPTKRKKKEEQLDVCDSKKPRFTDVLLADWNEEEEEDKKEKSEDDKTEDEKNADETKLDLPSEDGESKSENASASASINSTENPDSQPLLKNQSGKMSCFDFDEEEDGFIGMSNANTYGRKIPRVIPVKDKSDLGIDLEIEELFKRKSESESELGKESGNEEVEKNNEKIPSEEVDDAEIGIKAKSQEKQSAPVVGKRRRSKASKDEDVKSNAEDSLALRRTRRPGAKKSYLNEVIEKIEDEEAKPSSNVKKEGENLEVSPVTKVETGSSSRRKQDFKNQNIDSSREEMVYSEIVPEDQKTKVEQFEKKSRKSRKEATDDLTAKIDNLLEETKLSNVPEITDALQEKSENTLKLEEIKPNTTSFSFDYTPNDVLGKKGGKQRNEVKSISRMFSDSIPSSEVTPQGEQQEQLEPEENKSEEASASGGSQNKNVQGVIVKLSQAGNTAQKRGSIVLNSLPKISEGGVKVLPVVKQISSSKDCVVVPAGKKVEVKEGEQLSESEAAQRPKNIKTIKVKSDSLPSSLITSGKLKGQTIIHQKGGKYVIVTQPPQAGRQRTTQGKVQAGNKVVIFTNQLGEQKIITTSGLQQAKFKVEGQKIIAAQETVGDKEVATPSSSQAQPQSVIKMVPDGKGGIMKQITMSPKKVILGGTKVLVSASGGNTLSQCSTIQKIALPSGAGGARTGGDFRLIENYKGSGKTVLIQGSPSPSSGVVLKSSSAVPRQVTKVIQNPQAIPALKKKPKILMRASTRQGEYVMQPASGTVESPTYVVKQKGADGKISAQKIIRTDTSNQAKVLPSSTGTKRFFLSGQTANKNGESYIITTNEAVPSKIIRMRQKIKDVDASATQKIIQKAPEIYTISQNSVLLPNQTTAENEPAQIVQIQEQPQQSVLQTQVIAMPGPVRSDGNQTYVLVSVDEHGVVQGMDNSIVAYDACAQQDQIFVNSTTAGNVILLNSQSNEEVTPVYSTSGQDILAEALANTNVLEGNLNNDMEVVPSILLPPSMPSSVVQETSITLQKPIMTPLEMPSSVTPDTSGLEPPPLPPTPTNEDVLMEESEMSVAEGLSQEQLMSHDKKDEIESENVVHTYLQSENFEVPNDESQTAFQISTGFAKMEENQEMSENFEKPKMGETENLEQRTNDTYPSEIQESSGQNKSKLPSQEEYLIENSQEEQSTNSYQSMPLLNDEPDTSDDAQNSEPIGDQQFETQKSRLEAEQFSQIIREQEPPSSTNNENPGSEFDEGSNYHPIYQTEGSENEPKGKEASEEKHVEEQTYDENKEDLTAGKESQSMPIITDDNPNGYEMVEPVYSEVMSQKRFQEETEVSSTTDEYENKSVSN